MPPSITNKLPTSESIEEEPAELSGSEDEPGETQDDETVIATQSLEEEESTVSDAAEEVKSKEKEKDISDEPVKSAPPAKEQSTGIVSVLIIVY